MAGRLAAVLGAAILVAAAAPAQAAGGDGYRGWVACSHRAGAAPSHSCARSGPIAAFFSSSRHDATVKVCVRLSGKKKGVCAPGQPVTKGKPRVNTITVERTGRYRATWYVDGRLVDSWRFRVTAG